MAYLKDQLILAVPGVGFGRQGYFRLSLCLGEDLIEKSLDLFKKARANALAGVKA
jgi:aspartate aminotransferase